MISYQDLHTKEIEFRSEEDGLNEMSSPFLALPLLEAAHEVIEQLQKSALETGNEKSEMGKKIWGN